MSTALLRAPTWRRALATILGALALAAYGLVPAAADTAAETGARDRWEVMVPSNTGIPGNYVYGVAVDAKDRPWVVADDPVWDEGGLGTVAKGRWRQWTNVDGKAPTHEMRNPTFDASGKAWMGSAVGLLALDGKKVKTVWSRANAPAWPTNHVRDFDWDSAGHLWVALSDVTGVKGGVARYDGTTWKVWTTATGLPWPAPWDQVSALEIDDQDRVWIGSPTQGGAVFDGTSWTALGHGSGAWVYDIAIAPDGTPWYGFLGQLGVRTWSGSSWVDRTGPWGDKDISLVEVDREGRVWVGRFNGTVERWSGSGATWDKVLDPPSLGGHVYGLAFDSKNRPSIGGIGGLNVLGADGAWTVFNVHNTGLPSRWVDSVTVDAAGDPWFSTGGGGLATYDGKRWTDFGPDNWGSAPWPWTEGGLHSDSTTDTAQAPDGTIWTAPTNHGVGAWDGERWTTHLPTLSIESVAVGPDGTVWAMPLTGEVQRWDGTRWTAMGNPTHAFRQHEVTVDAQGDVWVATTAGLLRFDGTTWTTYRAASSGLPADYVFDVAAEPSGDAVWAATESGLARFDGTTWTAYDEDDGMPADVVTAVAVAPDGDIWAGAFDGQTWPYHGGLGHFDGTTWTSYTTANSPLPHNQVAAVAVGADGRVWVSAASEGIAVVTPRA